jgi:hypothetical protein
MRGAQHSRNRWVASSVEEPKALPEQVAGELGRGSQGGDRLLHELEPLDRPKPLTPQCTSALVVR